MFDSFVLLAVLCVIWTSGTYPPDTLLATSEPDWFVPFTSLAERVIAEKTPLVLWLLLIKIPLTPPGAELSSKLVSLAERVKFRYVL